MLKTAILTMTLAIGCLTMNPKTASTKYAFQDTTLTDKARIESLIKELTLDEKINLLGTSMGVPRLGIPNAGTTEGLHGITMGGPAREGEGRPTTIYMQAYGLGETWDPELVERLASHDADVARWYSQSPDAPQMPRHPDMPADWQPRQPLIVFAPNSDLARDPRWGRTEESFGEDPHLAGELTIAKVRGLQGNHPRYWKTVSLMKHFLANSNEMGRDSTSSDFSERLFNEYYSYPFRLGITDANAGAFMAAYNGWNGTAMAMHPVLQNTVRDVWGHKGIICTDGGAMKMLYTAHHAATSLPDAAAKILKASTGVYLDAYREPIREALASGLVTEADIDNVLRNNLYVALRLGILDSPDSKNPYLKIGKETMKEAPYLSAKSKALVREAMAKSVVLLKNDAGKSGRRLLPLSDDIKTIALIGTNMDTVIQDWYGGQPPYNVTLLQAFKDYFEPKGVRVLSSPDNRMDQGVEIAKEADVVFFLSGNHPYGTKRDWFFCPVPSDGREAVDRRSLTLPDEDVLRQLYAANHNTVLLLQSSFPYAINWAEEHLPAIVHFTHSSQETGNGVVDVLTGKVNPAGRLTQTWVKDILDLPPMMDYDITNGRTYMYSYKEPLYPFGYGLSYTSFTYDDIKTGNPKLKSGVIKDWLHSQTFPMVLTVSNSGDLDGEEVVQVYASWPDSKVSGRPIRKLVGFKRIPLAKGESKSVEIPIRVTDLGYWDEDSDAYRLEPGTVTLSAGGNSTTHPLSSDIIIK